MTAEEAPLDEVPEPELEGLLRKLSWALRQEPAPRPGGIRFYRVAHRFVALAMDLIREAAETHRESYRRFIHQAARPPSGQKGAPSGEKEQRDGGPVRGPSPDGSRGRERKS